MNNQPAPGYSRFEKFLLPLEDLIVKAAAAGNPAQYLYDHKGRDLFFRLEALARIYRKIHNKKFFDSLNDDFKQMEDALGSIDYDDAYVKEFSPVGSLPSAFVNHFIAGREAAFEKTNKYLRKGGWLSGSKGKVNEILDKLRKADWLEPQEDKAAIAAFLKKQLDKFTEQVESGDLNFKDLEAGLHEFRRKLRWFSIYATALDGLLQLKKTAVVDDGLEQYIQPEIVSSPFNIFPPAQSGIEPIQITDRLFYALSWMINETGTLKDAGLRTEAIHAALKEAGLPEHSVSQLMDKDEATLPDAILLKAKKIGDEFIKEKKVMQRIREEL